MVRLASALAVLAHVARTRGDLEEAEQLAVRGWELQETLPVGHPDRGSALRVLAAVHLESGSYLASLREYEQVRRELWPGMTADERDIVDNNLGWLLCRVDRCPEARHHFEVVISHQRENHSLHDCAQSGLAMVELAEGLPFAARDRARGRLAALQAIGRAGNEELTAELSWSLAVALSRTGASAAEVQSAAATALTWYRRSARHPTIARELEALASRGPP